MKHKTLHSIIVLTTGITAIIHTFILSYMLGEVSIMFILNGVGFFTLLAAWYFTPGFLANQRTALHAAFIGYTILTIVAWIAIGDKTDLLGIFTKVVEVVLMLSLIMHFRSPETAATNG